jgi:hypothetical protein
MRALSPLNRNKSALSNIVAYVLLISITISLSVLVYGWLRFYVTGNDIETCSDNVNVIIRSYECYYPAPGTSAAGTLIVNLKNKGLFTIDGYELRVHDREGAGFGFYLFDDVGVSIKPGEEWRAVHNFSSSLDGTGLANIALIEVQPFMREGSDIRCKSYAFQEVVCT